LNTISSIANNAYPPIYHTCRVLRVDGEPVVAVIIPGSLSRPHFAGKAYIRIGHSTHESNEEQFAELIAIRQSKVFELQRHVGKSVSRWQWRESESGKTLHRNATEYTLLACNAHYLTIGIQNTDSKPESLSLD